MIEKINLILLILILLLILAPTEKSELNFEHMNFNELTLLRVAEYDEFSVYYKIEGNTITIYGIYKR